MGGKESRYAGFEEMFICWVYCVSLSSYILKENIDYLTEKELFILKTTHNGGK
jgi:hypothetical protein